MQSRNTQTLKERREELAQQYYQKTYDDCCYKQQDAINSIIKGDES